MENNFAYLEEKVLKAVGLIQDLRAENTRLQEHATDLEHRYAAMKDDKEDIEQQLDETRMKCAEIENFEAKRRVIEEKVGGLLETLGQID